MERLICIDRAIIRFTVVVAFQILVSFLRLFNSAVLKAKTQIRISLRDL